MKLQIFSKHESFTFLKLEKISQGLKEEVV